MSLRGKAKQSQSDGIASSPRQVGTPRNDSLFNSIHTQPWPTYDPKYLVEDEVTIVVQVNGKVRDSFQVQSAKCKVQSFIKEEARRREKVKKYLDGKSVRKVIYVEGKIINFVTE